MSITPRDKLGQKITVSMNSPSAAYMQPLKETNGFLCVFFSERQLRVSGRLTDPVKVFTIKENRNQGPTGSVFVLTPIEERKCNRYDHDGSRNRLDFHAC